LNPPSKGCEIEADSPPYAGSQRQVGGTHLPSSVSNDAHPSRNAVEPSDHRWFGQFSTGINQIDKRHDFVACLYRCVDQSLQSVVRKVMQSNRAKGVLRLFKLVVASIQVMRTGLSLNDAVLALVARECPKALGIHFFDEIDYSHRASRKDLCFLAGCQSARKNDRCYGHTCLCPGSPLTLGDAEGAIQPAAIIDRIGHFTSPVSMQRIVSRGCW